MSIFKYTAANKEDKKLSGSIEAPDEKTARDELNNLGFSILELKEEKEEPPKELESKDQTDDHKKYVFESINPQGQQITGTISSIDEVAAFKRLTEEYDLTVTAIWEEGTPEEQIANVKARGTFHLQEILNSELENKKIKEEHVSQQQRKTELFVKTKAEDVLKQVNELLIEYEKEIPPDKKKEIDKRIDKLLRIKNSTNTNYIVETAEDLLKTIQKLEVELKTKIHMDKRTKLKLKVKDMINRLHETNKPKSISEDIVKNIQNWQSAHVTKAAKIPWHTRTINKILTKIEKIFETPEEIQILKAQIKTYNSQIIEYIKIYFREPTKEYKEKAKEAIKTIWKTRKKATEDLKLAKQNHKKGKKTSEETSTEPKQEFLGKLNIELTEFTGWLLAFYLTYYFVSLYITSKNFGIIADPLNLPKSLNFYHTQIFKYVLAIVFLLHVAFTLKTNFFKKTKAASLVLFPLTTFAIIFVLVNF